MDSDTVKTMPQAEKPKNVALRQVFMTLGILAIVFAIPVTLTSILQSPGTFETRREAAGGIESYLGNLYKAGGLPFAATYILGDSTKSAPREVITGDGTSVNLIFLEEDVSLALLENEISERIDNLNVDTLANCSNGYCLVPDPIVTEPEIQNSPPVVELIGLSGEVAYVGSEDPFQIRLRVTDTNGPQGDYLESFELDIPDWLDLSPFIQSGQTFSGNESLVAILSGVPTEVSDEVTINASVTDFFGGSATDSFTFQIKEENVPPVIEPPTLTSSYTFETGCTTKTETSYKFSFNAKAVDLNEDVTTFKVRNVSPATLDVKISGNNINFTAKKADAPKQYSFDLVAQEVGTPELLESEALHLTFNTQIKEIPCPEKEAPSAVIKASPLSGSPPLTVLISGADSFDPDGQVVSYKWTFGDGQNQTHNNPISFEHIYTDIGIYNLVLEVEDNDGLKDQTSTTIRVGENNAPSLLLTKPNGGTFSGSQNNPNNRIIWSVKDKEGDAPLGYTISLLSATSGLECTYSTLLTATEYIVAKGNADYNESTGLYFPLMHNWNTDAHLSGKVPDGHYCLKISVVDNDYGHNSVDYSDDTIEISNAEHPPYIVTSSIPEAVKDESYSTQIVAADEDDDSLTFNKVYGPDFLNIDDNGRVYGIPNQSGPFSVIIAVSDGKSERSRSYTLNVKAKAGQVLPAITLSTNIEVFVASDGKITWTLENAQDVSKLSIEYSTDGKDWLAIVEDLTKEDYEYIWDVSTLEDGEYMVRIVYYDADGNKLGASDIQNIEVSNPKETIESFPSVFNIKPKEDESTDDKTPVISANFSPSRQKDVKVESIEVYLNGKQLGNITGFTAFEGGFTYLPREEFEEGEHTIKVKFTDSADKTAEKEWNFTISSLPETGAVEIVTTPETSVNRYLIAITTIIFIGTATVIAYISVRKLQEERILKSTFAPKITPVSQIPFEEQETERVFRRARAVLEKEAEPKS